MDNQQTNTPQIDQNNNTEQAPKQKTWFERNPKKTIFLVVLLGIIILPFVLEGVAYFLVKAEDRERVREGLKVQLQQLEKQKQRRQIVREIYDLNNYKLYDEVLASQKKVKTACYQPYSVWRTCESKTSMINIDKYGVRASLLQANTKNKTEFTIYALGGSTTLCNEADDNNTWASHLQKMLNNTDAKFHYKIVNFGSGSYLNNQEMIRLFLEAQNSFKFYGKPNLVIFYDGINELNNFLFKHDYVGAAHYDVDKIASRFEKNILHEAKLFFKNTFKKLISEKSQAKLKLLFINISTLIGQDFTTTQQDINAIHQKASQIKHYYKTNIELINHLAKVSDFKVVFFLQSTLYDKDKRYWTEFDRKIYDACPWCNAQFEEIYFATSSKLAELAKEYNNFIDVRDIFNIPNISVHLDNCHVVPKGNELIAQRLFSELKKRGYVD